MLKLLLPVQLYPQYFLTAFFFPGFFQHNYIFHCNYIDMMHVILPNLELVLFVVCLVVKSFKKVLMLRLTIGSIIVYHTTIIPNTLNKVANCIEFRVVKDWLT